MAAKSKKNNPTYKLPACWLGVPYTTYEDRKGKLVEVVVQHVEADIQSACTCTTPRQAFTCSTGHLDECHAGLPCEKARCNHYLKKEASSEKEQKSNKERR